MTHVIVRHKVKDYSAWRPVFDEHAPMRHEFGCRNCNVFTDINDPNMVFIHLEWDNETNAKRFSESNELRDAMNRSGVVGNPDFHICCAK